MTAQTRDEGTLTAFALLQAEIINVYGDFLSPPVLQGCSGAMHHLARTAAPSGHASILQQHALPDKQYIKTHLVLF